MFIAFLDGFTEVGLTAYEASLFLRQGLASLAMKAAVVKIKGVHQEKKKNIILSYLRFRGNPPTPTVFV